jgi:Hypothetical protein (DUF2513).
MALNQDCVRDLLVYIDALQEFKSSGKPKVVKLRFHLNDVALEKYERQEILLAAKYLLDKKLIAIVAFDPSLAAKISPRQYNIQEITALGYDFLEAIKNDTVWGKLKKQLGSITLSTIPELITLAVQLALPQT